MTPPTELRNRRQADDDRAPAIVESMLTARSIMPSSIGQLVRTRSAVTPGSATACAVH